MSYPRVLIEKPYVASLTIYEEREVAAIRLDNEANLPFWFELHVDLKTNEVLYANGRTGEKRAEVDVECERRPDGVHVGCHDNTNDWHTEFKMVGV